MSKMIFLMGPINPATNNLTFRDSYIVLAEALIEKKIIKKAIFLYNNDFNLSGKKKDICRDIQLDSLANLRNYLSCDYKAVFVRGNWQEHPQVVRKLKYKKLFFYAADSHFWPIYLKKELCDYILADNNKQIKELNLILPKAKSFIFNKMVDSNVFKPKKVKKKYDLCYVANFRSWKNHNMLFSAIRKWQNKKKKKLKIALMGKLTDNLAELKILLWKYNIEADLFDAVAPQKVAQILNQAKFSVQAGELDANPRAISESLACNVPVLINRDITGGTHLINNFTGIKINLARFDQGINLMLRDYNKFKARDYFEKNLNAKKITSFFDI